MKKDQVHVFEIECALTPARRKAIETQIDDNAKATTEPVAYSWDAEDDAQLHIDVGPAKLDVVFYEDIVELYVDAPLWARVLITKEKEAALVALVEAILQKAKLADGDAADRSANDAASA
jgi:hypothetical protein